MPAFGINYGHHFSSLNYNPAVVEHELAMLARKNIQIIRVAYPPFDSLTAVTRCQDICIRALSRNFKVIWGVGAAGATLNTTRWEAFKAYVKNTFLPWAESLHDSRFTASLGNEEDFHNDGITLTSAVVRQDIANDLAAYAQGVLTQSACDYVTDAGQRADWQADGLGSLDRIGFNLYYEWLPYGTFLLAADQIIASFGAAAYIAEWSTNGGFEAAAANAGSPEAAWADNVYNRRKVLDDHNIDHCFFTFKDGGFGLPADKWALQKANGQFRTAWFTITTSRQNQARSMGARQTVSRNHSVRDYASFG